MINNKNNKVYYIPLFIIVIRVQFSTLHYITLQKEGIIIDKTKIKLNIWDIGRDRQTDRQMDRSVNRGIDGQMDGWMDE